MLAETFPVDALWWLFVLSPALVVLVAFLYALERVRRVRAENEVARRGDVIDQLTVERDDALSRVPRKCRPRPRRYPSEVRS